MTTVTDGGTAAGSAPGVPDSLAARLADPEVAASLHVLLDNAATLAFTVEALDGFLRRGDVIAESLATGVRDVLPALGDLEGVAAQAGTVAARAPELFAAFEALVESGMLRPQVLEVLGTLAGALVEGADRARQEGTSVGVFGALRALRDPDVARGLGLLVEVARALGRAV
ncbi:MAG: DUF1641 domain-containing protein [Kineosporiaceae bacterium]